MITLFDRQADVIRAVHNNSIVLVPGPIRCGKTAGAVTAFLVWAASFRNERFALVAPTIKQVRDVLVPAIREATGSLDVTVRGGNERPMVSIDTNEFLIFGAADSQSESRMRGYQFRGVYYDEVSERADDNMFKFLIGRCSMQPFRIVATCNPKGPSHWVKKDLIDAQPSGFASVPFKIDDNPHLPDEWKKITREQFTGAMLRREYYGEWAAAEGAIFGEYSTGIPPTDEPVAEWWAVDVGTSSPTHALQFGEYANGDVWVTDEYRSEPGSDIEQQYQSIRNRFRGAGYADPSAAAFKVYLQDRGMEVRNAQAKPVLDGISLTASVLKHRHVYISKICGELITEMDNYSWDANKVDTPIKRDDHGCDALRYGVMAWFSVVDNRFVSVPLEIE